MTNMIERLLRMVQDRDSKLSVLVYLQKKRKATIFMEAFLLNAIVNPNEYLHLIYLDGVVFLRLYITNVGQI